MQTRKVLMMAASLVVLISASGGALASKNEARHKLSTMITFTQQESDKSLLCKRLHKSFELSSGETRRFRVSYLLSGLTYKFLVAGDNGIKGISIDIVNSDDESASTDSEIRSRSGDSMPSVTFKPEESGEYKVDITVTRGSGAIAIGNCWETGSRNSRDD